MWNLTWEVGCCVALVCINNKVKALAVLLAASESIGKKRISSQKRLDVLRGTRIQNLEHTHTRTPRLPIAMKS